jgi:hypothetical protein
MADLAQAPTILSQPSRLAFDIINVLSTDEFHVRRFR